MIRPMTTFLTIVFARSAAVGFSDASVVAGAPGGVDPAGADAGGTGAVFEPGGGSTGSVGSAENCSLLMGRV